MALPWPQPGPDPRRGGPESSVSFPVPPLEVQVPTWNSRGTKDSFSPSQVVLGDCKLANQCRRKTEATGWLRSLLSIHPLRGTPFSSHP